MYPYMYRFELTANHFYTYVVRCGTCGGNVVGCTYGGPLPPPVRTAQPEARQLIIHCSLHRRNAFADGLHSEVPYSSAAQSDDHSSRAAHRLCSNTLSPAPQRHRANGGHLVGSEWPQVSRERLARRPVVGRVRNWSKACLVSGALSFLFVSPDRQIIIC